MGVGDRVARGVVSMVDEARLMLDWPAAPCDSPHADPHGAPSPSSPPPSTLGGGAHRRCDDARQVPMGVRTKTVKKAARVIIEK